MSLDKDTLTRFQVRPPGKEPCADEDYGESFWFWCFGCESYHSFRTKRYKGELKADGSPVPVWTFNGNMDKPTFAPSLLYQDIGCHLFLRDGVLEYLGDCKHELKGKNVPLGHDPRVGG